MKIKSIFAAILFLSFPVIADNTLTLEEEYRDGSDKVCVYGDGHRTVVINKKGAGSCPGKHISRG